MKRIYTYQVCLKDARKYQTPTEWYRASPSAYRASLRQGWHTECTAHMTRPWTFETCLQDAMRFENINQWKGSAAHHSALWNGWIKDEKFRSALLKINARWFIKKPKWNFDSLLKEAKKYSCIQSWSGHSSYYHASRMGLIQNKDFRKELLALNKDWFSERRHPYKWTFAACVQNALHYEDVKEWRKGSPTVYVLLKRREWYESFKQHVIKHKPNWFN